MSKYKVGDYVTFVREHKGFTMGRLYKIISVEGDYNHVIDNNVVSRYFSDRFQDVRKGIVDNELNRRLYPNHVKFGDYLIINKAVE